VNTRSSPISGIMRLLLWGVVLLQQTCLARVVALSQQTCLACMIDPSYIKVQATGSLSNFIASESPIALQGVLNNIGPNGTDASGASPGIVIASPSTSNPNCTSGLVILFSSILVCVLVYQGKPALFSN
jgi:hypothetical protein